MSTLVNLSSTLLFGVLTPLTAVCVIPLYPGFISFLSGKLNAEDERRGRPVALGALVMGGVVAFMLALGLVFTTIIGMSLTRVVKVILPIAFGILAVIGILLILNIDAGRFFKQARVPASKSPQLSAFLYGFFFGAIIIPCNPGIIAAFFTKAFATSTADYMLNMLHFLLFAVGIGVPLLVIAVVSGSVSKSILRFLVANKSTINRVTGVIMLGVSVYYIFFVFRIFAPLIA